MKIKKVLWTIMTMVMIASLVVACAPKTTGTDGGKIKVGLSFSDFATERWKNEEILMRGLLEDLGY
ncbi:MAG: D-xylose transporter subunit XylF, partial [Anaerolineaceae bacterium]|nr:D-xylose transporter subunit XylF [Anaerolineaceae bacterium]